MTTSKPDNRIRTAFDVNGVDEAHALGALGCHYDRRRANACSEKAHAAKYRPVRHTGRREDDFLARRQIVSIVDAVRVVDSHRFHSFDRVFADSLAVFEIFKLFLQDEARKYLSVEAL